MKSKKRTIAVSATIAVLVIVLVYASMYLIKPASPLALWIDVGLFCEETGEPIPDGLAVNLVGPGYDMTAKTKAGHVEFGSGLVDATYTVSWYWCKPYLYELEINCSKITWNFDFSVPNPTIIKHFRYDTVYGETDHPPVVGLNVTLVEDGTAKTWALTDAAGTVVFGGQYVNVCQDYYLEWLWGSDPYSEGPIHFGPYDALCRLDCSLISEQTNDLQAKSGLEAKTSLSEFSSL